jgi:hypothetical protein
MQTDSVAPNALPVYVCSDDGGFAFRTFTEDGDVIATLPQHPEQEHITGAMRYLEEVKLVYGKTNICFLYDGSKPAANELISKLHQYA